jgi:hypothetical protein
VPCLAQKGAQVGVGAGFLRPKVAARCTGRRLLSEQYVLQAASTEESSTEESSTEESSTEESSTEESSTEESSTEARYA